MGYFEPSSCIEIKISIVCNENKQTQTSIFIIWNDALVSRRALVRAMCTMYQTFRLKYIQTSHVRIIIHNTFFKKTYKLVLYVNYVLIHSGKSRLWRLILDRKSHLQWLLGRRARAWVISYDQAHNDLFAKYLRHSMINICRFFCCKCCWLRC